MTAASTTSWRRVAALLLALGILLIAVKQGPTGLGHIGVDVAPRYVAGRLVSEGDSPYDDDAVFAREHELGRTESLPVNDAPPVVAVLRLLSAMPLRLFAFVIFAGSMLVVVGLAALLTPGGGWLERVVASAAIVMFSAVHTALFFGQIDVLCFAPVALAIARERRGRSSPSLAPFVLLKPQTILLPSIAVAGLALRRDAIRAVVGMAATTAALVVFAAVVAPSASWIDWFHQVGDRGLHADGDEALLAVIAIVGAANGLWQLWRRRGAGRFVDVLVVAAAANSLLAGTGAWNPQWHVGLVLPVGALLVAAATEDVALPVTHRALLAAVAVFSVGEAWTTSSLVGLGYIRGVLVSIVALAAIAVVLRLVPLWLGAALAAAALAVNAAHLTADHRAVIPVAVAAILVHLVITNGVTVPRRTARFAT